jgi:gas vesicle protein
MKNLKYIFSIAIAASAGLAIGYLTAPRSGKRTRAKLMDEFEDTKHALEDAASKKLEDAKKAISKTIEAQQNNGKEAISKLKEVIRH